MKIKKAVAGLMVGFFIAPAFAWADDNAAILERLAALEQEIKILKRQLELNNETEKKKASESAVVIANAKDGFSIQSADESFKIRLRGTLQADARFFTDNAKDNGTTDTFLVRRARPIFEGTLWKSFSFLLTPDFGAGSTSLVDAYIDYKHSPALKVRAGKFKEPFQLERLRSDSFGNFAELGLPANLTPSRDVGVQLHGDVWSESLSYALGVFNGSPDQGSSTSTDVDTNNDKDVAARLFAHPFKNTDQNFVKGLGVGAAMTHGHKEGSSLPTFRSPAQASVFSFHSGVTADGPHTRFSPQGYWYWNSFSLLTEYVVSNQELIRGAVSDKFENKAWQVSGTYVLTGEDASFNGVKPRQPFDLSLNQWGAFEIAARYGELDLDDAFFSKNFASPDNSITEEAAWAFGLNWYLNNNIRLMLDFEHTDFEGGAPGSDRKDENAVFTRFQLVY